MLKDIAMTNTPGYTHAIGAYQDVQDKHMSGIEISVELYKGVIKNLYKAKEAFHDKRLEDVVELNTKNNKILIALQSNLSSDPADEASVWLNDFYNHIFLRMSSIFRHDDPVQEYDELIKLVKPVHDHWASFIPVYQNS